MPKDQRVTFISKPFYLIYGDVWRPSKVTTLSVKRWFATFIDDRTKLCWVYLFAKKSDVARIFKYFFSIIEAQFNIKICILQFGNGSEYFNECLGEFLKEKGILHQSTCCEIPQQNGIVERKNRLLLEVARALMFSMNAPKHL